MQHLHNRQTRINANEIRQLQRAHGHIRPILHDIIDILLLPHARLQTDDRFVDIRHEDPVREEAGRVRGLRRHFAHFLDDGQGGRDGGRGGLQAGDDLDAFLHGDGVHEVGADDAGGGGEVGGVVLWGRGGGDFGDGYGGGVRGEDGVGGADLGELGEDGGFERGDLGDGFDDEVGG